MSFLGESWKMTDAEADRLVTALRLSMASPHRSFDRDAYDRVESISILHHKGDAVVEVRYIQGPHLRGHRQSDLSGLGGQDRDISPEELALDIRDFVIVEPQGSDGQQDDEGRYWS